MKRIKRKKSESSMRAHLWRVFVIFAVIIMASLWLLQIIFLNTFYEGMKRSEIEKIGMQLVNYYETDMTEFNKYWDKHYFGRGIFANLLTSDGNIIRSPETMEEFRNSPKVYSDKKIPDFNSENWSKFVAKVNESQTHTTTYIVEFRKYNKMMVFGAKLAGEDGNSTYLYMCSPIEPIDTTREVLQNQLLIVTVLSLVLGLLFAYFIAKKFSRPIEKISKSANELACGKYDVVFSGGLYNEINELAVALNNAAKQLGQTDELRRDLMANVSHDLKTPLTIIRSYAEMIRDISGENKEKRDAHTQVIIDETNRLSELVSDILSLSKIESGNSKPEVKRICLSLTVKTVIERLSEFCERDGFVIKSEIEDNIYTMADEGQIMQVVYNLVGNALNYTGDDKTVSISLKREQNRAVFSVKDSGNGIEKSEIPLVWDRYYRSGKSHKRETVGTGIGLSIVKRILDSHGALYGVKSQIGIGSVFYFKMDMTDGNFTKIS